MKSPTTGKEMPIQIGRQQFWVNCKPVQAMYLFYQCKKTGRRYTTEGLDEINLDNLYEIFSASPRVKLEYIDNNIENAFIEIDL